MKTIKNLFKKIDRALEKFTDLFIDKDIIAA